jgi:hypothetical protein
VADFQAPQVKFRWEHLAEFQLVIALAKVAQFQLARAST